MERPGKVFLVGAGPGDPELLTLKALRVLQVAEAIVYDRLASAEVLALAPKGALMFGVGKAAQYHPFPQPEIHRLLIGLARKGRTVVRLKGGDPFIFGRGGEEALALAQAGIPFEVIPGITAAQACAASAGVPLTHRGIANSVRFLTGHGQSDAQLNYDWQGLANPGTTLALYMGLQTIPAIAGGLIAHGRSPDTPAMAISHAATSAERRLTSTLGQIASAVAGAGFEPPTLFIIGEVVSLPITPGRSCDAMAPHLVAAE